MPKKYDIIVTGNYSVDLIFTGLPGLPEIGKEVVGTGFEMIPGESYTSAIAMHRLGVKVGWAADFGDDDFSRFALEKVEAEGLDDGLFVYHKRPLRRISIAASFPGDRAFITYYDPDPPIPAVLKMLPLTSARFFYLPGFYYGSLFDAGLALVRAKRMKLVMDGNSAENITLEMAPIRKSIQNVDIFLPNAREARQLTGEQDIQRGLLKLGEMCPLVVVKDGPRGAYACVGGEIIHSPGIAITPTDTTGAGDAFNAGFIRAWIDELPLEQCLRWGNVVGGLSTLERGGTGKVITCKDVENWL